MVGKGWDRSLRIFWVSEVTFRIHRRGVIGYAVLSEEAAVVPADGRED